MTSQRFECEICNINIHRKSIQKHLRSRKHIENVEENEIIISERIRMENIRNVIEQLRNQQSLELLPGNNIILK